MMADVKLSDQQYRQAIDFIVNAQRYRFPIERAHIDTLLEILLTPKQAAADEMFDALNLITMTPGVVLPKRLVDMALSALAKAGQP